MDIESGMEEMQGSFGLHPSVVSIPSLFPSTNLINQLKNVRLFRPGPSGLSILIMIYSHQYGHHCHKSVTYERSGCAFGCRPLQTTYRYV